MTRAERKKELRCKYFQAAVIAVILVFNIPLIAHGVKDVMVRDGIIIETESTDFDK